MSLRSRKLFCLLPLTYQIDIRTDRFLEQFKLPDNCICSLFARQAESSIKRIFAAYSDNINTVTDLKNTVEDIFFDGQIGD